LSGRKKSITFGGATSLTVTLLLLLAALPFPSDARLAVVFLLALGWLIAACRWTILRYGRRGGALVAVVALALTGWAGTLYWLDGPNRRLVAQIEQLPGCSAFTTGRIFTGEVNHVHIGSRASNKEVWQITQLEGLNHLERVFVDDVPIRAETAKQFGRFTTLRFLLFRGTGVSEETLDELQQQLPDCDIWVK
jgi:hypothetical protein